MDNHNNPHFPFTSADYVPLKRLQRELQQHAELLAKCRDCGISCDAECQGVAVMQDFASNIEKHFFSPPPRDITLSDE